VNALAEATLKEFGKIDILINNAGGGDGTLGKQLPEITDEDWRRGIDTNLTSQFYGCRAVAPQMVKQKRGKIINIASGYALRGGKHNFMYACAKGGTIQLTRSMALTYADYNIQTNCIVPGIFPHNERLMASLFMTFRTQSLVGSTRNTGTSAELSQNLTSRSRVHPVALEERCRAP
jgi:NAD(P)-dependent dehydrogenase (short-subunit alcohol dehydrogenase family)